MEPRIVVITSHFLYEPIRAALERLALPYRVTLTVYDDLSQIHTVYNRYAAQADGFLVSGRCALAAIRLAPHRISKPIVSFQPNSNALYRTLLRIFLEDRTRSADRVMLDALLPLGGGCTASDFMRRTESECIDAVINAWLDRADFQEVAALEEKICRTLVELWSQGQMDLAVCQFSSIIPTLQAHGIPVRYPFISDHQLSEHIQRLLQEIELARHRANLPAMVHVIPRDRTCDGPEELARLRRYLLSFFRDEMLDCVIQRYQRGFAVGISVQAVQDFTAGGTGCALAAYLNSHLDFEVAVGYGVGSTVSQAFNNAHTAALESLCLGGSFIKDESSGLVGPLDSHARMVLPDREAYEVARIARDCSLSPLTIRKLLCAFRCGDCTRTTAQELSLRFGVTSRNASRILSQLEQGGYARSVCSRSSSGKGRPAKVYELQLDL